MSGDVREDQSGWGAEVDAPGVEVEVEPPQSLIETFVPREWPGRVGLWRAALQIPTPPTMSSGEHGLAVALPESFLEDLEFATYIGNVRAMGPLCFKSRTSGGVELKDDPGFKIGDWVMIDKHAGRKYRMRDGTLWAVISDTQYISVLDQPEEFDCMAL